MFNLNYIIAWNKIANIEIVLETKPVYNTSFIGATAKTKVNVPTVGKTILNI